MEHIRLVQELCGDTDRIAEEWLVTLVQRSGLREILEEYALVTDAFSHWSKTKGQGSSEALEYQRLIQERIEEIRAFVQRERALHKKPRS